MTTPSNRTSPPPRPVEYETAAAERLKHKHLTVNHYEDDFCGSAQIEFAHFNWMYGRQLTFPKQTLGIELCHFPSAMSLIVHQQMESAMRRSCKIIYVFIENYSTSAIMLLWELVWKPQIFGHTKSNTAFLHKSFNLCQKKWWTKVTLKHQYLLLA